MLKKSRIIAVLSVCVMMFAVVEPACAWDWGGSFWGTVIGGAAGIGAVIITGGAALPIIAGSTAIGACVGGVEDKEQLVSGAVVGTAVSILGMACGIKVGN